MINYVFRAVALTAAVSTATPAVAQTVQYTYPNGITRSINCKEAFYVFKDDPQRTMWQTCNGFEAGDVPTRGSSKADKEDTEFRDEICNTTNEYDPLNPISINDPRVPDVKNTFSKAMIAALSHVSEFHQNSVSLAINLRAKMGVDVFKVYDTVIRRLSSEEVADGFIPSTKEPFKYQSGWDKEKADASVYKSVWEQCRAFQLR